jgi:hypothetical protein
MYMRESPQMFQVVVSQDLRSLRHRFDNQRHDLRSLTPQSGASESFGPGKGCGGLESDDYGPSRPCARSSDSSSIPYLANSPSQVCHLYTIYKAPLRHHHLSSAYHSQQSAFPLFRSSPANMSTQAEIDDLELERDLSTSLIFRSPERTYEPIPFHRPLTFEDVRHFYSTGLLPMDQPQDGGDRELDDDEAKGTRGSDVSWGNRSQKTVFRQLMTLQ